MNYLVFEIFFREDNSRYCSFQTISNFYLKDKSAPRCILPVYLWWYLDRLLTGHPTVSALRHQRENDGKFTLCGYLVVVAFVYEYIIQCRKLGWSKTVIQWFENFSNTWFQAIYRDWNKNNLEILSSPSFFFYSNRIGIAQA